MWLCYRGYKIGTETKELSQNKRKNAEGCCFDIISWTMLFRYLQLITVNIMSFVIYCKYIVYCRYM